MSWGEAWRRSQASSTWNSDLEVAPPAWFASNFRIVLESYRDEFGGFCRSCTEPLLGEVPQGKDAYVRNR